MLIIRPMKLFFLPVTASPLKKARYSKAGQMLRENGQRLYRIA